MYKKYLFILFLTITSVAVNGQEDFYQLLNKAYDHLDKSEKEKAVSAVNDGFRLAKKRGDVYKMVIAKRTMGYISVELNDFEAAYVNFSDALGYLQKCDTVDLYNKTIILENMAMIKAKYADHQMSIVYYEEAFETAKKYVQAHRSIAVQNGDLSYLIDMPFFMAIEMKEIGDYEGAGEVLLEMWESSEYRGDTVSLARALNELGLIRLENEEYLSAQEFFSFVAFNKNIAPDTRAIALQNLAVTYSELGNLESSKKWFSEALAIKMDHSSNRSQFITMLDLGELEFKKGNTDEAIEHWETAITTYNALNSEPELFIVYDWLQKAYLRIDVDKSSEFGSLYTSNIQNWMSIQNNQTNNPTLQAFNTRIDDFMRTREVKAERLALIKQFWPAGIVFALLITLLIYQVQALISKTREKLLEQKVKDLRTVKAQQILDKIRRDD
jgi:tetratricopeptide (TPR) repeat protein